MIHHSHNYLVIVAYGMFFIWKEKERTKQMK